MTSIEQRIGDLEKRLEAMEAQQRPGGQVVVFEVVGANGEPGDPVSPDALARAQEEADENGIAFVFSEGGGPGDVTFKLLGRKVE